MSDQRRESAPEPRLEFVAESAIGPELDAAMRELLLVCFPQDAECYNHTRHWHGSASEFSLIHRRGARVLGNASVVIRTVLCAGRPATVAGVQNLAVAPELRKSGLSRRLMTEAMAEAVRRGLRWGLLFCVPGLGRFYASLGWRKLAVPVRMSDGRGGTEPIPAKNIAMALELSDEPFPAGDIDLQGADW
jgi:predicted N-acetyltransferase YhbS